jgi:hypothetical protein
MKKKAVYFGRVKTWQIQCIYCETWQFEDDKCCECGKSLKDENEIVYENTE